MAGYIIPEILKSIEHERDPHAFKEEILNLNQLYFDGLVENQNKSLDPNIWAEQSKTLNALLNGMKQTIVPFYRRHQHIPFDEVLETILPYSSLLIKHGSQNVFKTRWFKGREADVQNSVEIITKTLAKAKIDLILPVASGGFEPAILVADYLEIDDLFPIRYSQYSRKDEKVLVPTQAPQNYTQQHISGNKILFVEDGIDSGATASKLSSWITQYDPKKVYFAVIQASSHDLTHSSLHRHKNSRHLYKHHN